MGPESRFAQYGARYAQRSNCNLTLLLCRSHHTHFLQKGWASRINDAGLPEWIPHWWIDHKRRPQINTRIQRLNAHHKLRQRRQPVNAA